MFLRTLFLENEAQIDRNNYGTMLSKSKQVSLPKISSILQKMKIGQNLIYALFERSPSVSTSYLTGLFCIFILLHIWQNCLTVFWWVFTNEDTFWCLSWGLCVQSWTYLGVWGDDIDTSSSRSCSINSMQQQLRFLLAALKVCHIFVACFTLAAYNILFYCDFSSLMSFYGQNG